MGLNRQDLHRWASLGPASRRDGHIVLAHGAAAQVPLGHGGGGSQAAEAAGGINGSAADLGDGDVTLRPSEDLRAERALQVSLDVSQQGGVSEDTPLGGVHGHRAGKRDRLSREAGATRQQGEGERECEVRRERAVQLRR